ncbi:MAG: DUF2877 domain-containing protein [Rhodospirillaceae bacterium]|nr:DUF2877 domain-containing protein [Rhodospirillaceae bacterium]MBT3929423.1 DUF2877 domain-containing protein [Rhodospirillaceae bacterium]MBT4771516.1 DUF2877 domain-containing protein [Rhodospirillaceae bacterium]MBT5356817.1 DUF2877 domain-containing protein [Rhodospirillaceae bacterium]MBT5770675.1 DUF2877 domain-containing protein [Rhodospirillaceae bacterium]
MRLTVTDIPERFPTHVANGRAMSVHSRVMNIALNTNAGAVVTIDARRGAPLSPGTARLNAPDGMDFSRLVRPGAGLAMRAGILRVQGADLTFDFRNAVSTKWSDGPRWPRMDRSTLEAGWIETWLLFVDAAETSGFTAALLDGALSGGFDRALAHRVRTALPRLMRAAADTNFPDSWSSLRSLLGIGPGLTPSGDDFATGFFLGLGFSARSPRQQTFLRDLTRATLAQAHDSTDVSRACFEHAAAGRFSTPLTTLVEGIATHADNLPARLADALAMGHSSGRDAAFGTLCGLAVTEPELRTRVIDALDITYLHEKPTR